MSAHSESCITRRRFATDRKESERHPCKEYYGQPSNTTRQTTTGHSDSAQTPSAPESGVLCCVRVGVGGRALGMSGGASARAQRAARPVGGMVQRTPDQKRSADRPEGC